MTGSILNYDDISFLHNTYLKNKTLDSFLKETDGKFRVNKAELEMIWQAFDKASEYYTRRWWD